MIKLYCDICGEEINSWRCEMESSLQNPRCERSDKKTTLHFHDVCLREMFDYLEKRKAKE